MNARPDVLENSTRPRDLWPRPVLSAAVTVLATLAFVSAALAAPQTAPITEERLFEAVAAGGSLTLPAGSMVLSQPLVITRDFRLSGAGPEDTTIEFTGTGAAVRIESGASVTLDNFRIDASAANEAEGVGADLIQVLDGLLTLERMYLSGADYGAPDELKPYGYGTALLVTGASTATITQSFFQLNELVAVEATGSATVRINRSSFDRNVHGVLAEDDVSLDVTDCLIVSTEESAVTVRGRANVVIASSTLSANGVNSNTGYADYDALRFGDEAKVTLRDNLIEGNPRYALSMFGTAEVTAEANTFRGNGGLDEVADTIRTALLLEDSSRYVGSGDTIVENPGGAIEVIHDSAMLLNAPTITGNGSYASAWIDDSAEVVLIGATVAGNEGGLILTGEATLFLERGSFSTSGRDAVDASGSSHVTAVEATFVGNDGAGIYAYGEATATVLRSTFQSNIAGVVGSETASLEVDGSTFSQNQGPGVLFLDTTSGSVRSSVFQGNGGRAIDVRPAATVALEANEER